MKKHHNWNTDLAEAPTDRSVRILWCGNTGESSIGYRTYDRLTGRYHWRDETDERFYAEIYVAAWAKL